MLWWLLLLLIPLLVHLFNFRKYKKVIFSNTQFLRDVAKQTKKTKQLKKYLLLSTRTLLLSCIVFAFAIPYCGTRRTETLPQHFLIYLDNSASIQFQFEQAKNKARELVKLIGSKDKITIMTASDRPVSFVDKEEGILYIDQLEISAFGGNLMTIGQEQRRLEADGAVPTFVISDFQSNMTANFKDSLSNTWFIPLEVENKVNVGLDTTFLISPINGIDANLELIGVVHNYADKPIADIPLSLFLDGKVVASATVSLEAKQIQEVTLSLPKSNASKLSGLLRMDIEDLAFDNELYFNIKPQKEKIKILNLGNSNDFISSVFKTESIFDVSVKSELPSSIAGYQLLIINGYNKSAEQSAVLRNYVSKGGSVLLIPSESGQNVDFSYLGVSNWSQIDEKTINLSGINFKHPIYLNVYKSIPKNPVEPQVRKHYLISAQGTGQTILSTANEHPILIEASNGNGKVYQLAIPINKQWSDLPIVGYLFYPTLSNIAMGGARNKPLFGWLQNNMTPIEVENINLQGVEQFQLKKGNKAYTAELINRLEKTFLIPSSAIDEAGIYELVSSSSKENVARVALNLDRSESNLTFLNKDELKNFSERSGAEVYVNELAAHPIFKGKRGILDTTWKWFVVFALIFILIEIFLLRFI